MNQISIQDLKARLSAVVAEAEAGQTIVITRHHAAVAKLIPADQHLHRGDRFGHGELKPAIKTNARIPYLQVLSNDRGDR
jgi:prevent-host-death family protein